MITLLVALAVAQDPAVQRGVLDYLKTIGEVASALLVVLGILWWLVWPRIRDGIERIVRQVNETHHSVTVNGGKSNPPTLRDEMSHLAADLSDARKDVQGLIRASAANTRGIADLSDDVAVATHIAEDARDTLQAHVKSGERYLGKVEVVLKDHGIELPPGDE
jgi:methyl-accepting chemotaxis protein